MIGDRHPPDDWPLARDLTTDDARALDSDGQRLMWRLGDIQTFLRAYDMTTEEAIACLQYEITQYSDTYTSPEGWSYCPHCGADLTDPTTISAEETDCPHCAEVRLNFVKTDDEPQTPTPSQS